jgi:hypothetical protein
MDTTSHDDFFSALSMRPLSSEIEQRILLTETNQELAELGVTLMMASLNILTLLTPLDKLKASILSQIDEKDNHRETFLKALEKLTSASSPLK